MTKPEAMKAFFEIQAQLQHEGLLEAEQGAVKAALRGDEGEIFFAELSRANMTMQEIAPGRKSDPGPAFDWPRYLDSLATERQA